MRFIKTKLFAAFLSIAMLGPVQAWAEVAQGQSDATSAANSTLTLKISGLEPASGQLLVALFKSETDYKNETVFRDTIEPVKGQSVTVTFDNLSVGDYAFKMFHDVNSDGELNTDGLGIPKEPYYFSNDASDPFSAPEWEEAKFKLSEGKMQQSIEIN